MQTKGRVINKLALVLISIVVLELVLIGDRVQPVKGIKKKIYLKKLKKLLPLFALMKPKKKIILVPIPIPMFKSHGFKQPHYGRVPHATSSGPAPMSFMMMNGGEPNLIGVSGPAESPASAPESASMAAMVPLAPSENQPMGMMSSMTMSVQSEPSNASAPLLERPPGGTKWRYQQQQQHHNDHFDEPSEQPGGEHYYSSPWMAPRAPLVSPAKLLRNERLKTHQQQPPRPRPAAVAQPARQHQQRPAPASKGQWRPAEPAKLQQQPQQHQYHVGQQQQPALEYEELVPVGPAQVVPVYQTPNGQLHMTPPVGQLEPASSARPQPDEAQPARQPSADLSGEVQTVSAGEASGAHQPADDQHRQPAARFTSPAVKGKQQHQTKRKQTQAGY